MRVATETTLRYLALLQLLPVAPRRRSTSDIRKGLIKFDREYNVDIRTIQRDLEKLAKKFPLDSQSKGRTYYWCWTAKNVVTPIPTMNLNTAVGYYFAGELLKSQLPPTTYNTIAPYVKKAQEVIKESSRLGKWVDKLAVIDTDTVCSPAKVSEEIQNIIFEALFQERQIVMHFRPDADAKKKQERRTVNPLGLLLKDGTMLLLATSVDGDNVFTMPLQKISKVHLQNQTIHLPENWNIFDYVKANYISVGNKSDAAIELKLLMSSELVETFPSISTKEPSITAQDKGKVLYEATVVDSKQLRRWLLSYGADIEVVSPEPLRTEIVTIAKKVVAQYK